MDPEKNPGLNVKSRVIERLTQIVIDPGKVFIFAGILWGLAFLFITPPFQVPDEFDHFSRSFQLSEGRLLSEKHDNRLGGFLPQSLIETMSTYQKMPFNTKKKQKIENVFDLAAQPLDAENRTFIDFPNTALYSPVPYIPQTLGILTGKIFDLSPIVLMYMGRIFNLIVWIVLVYFSIKITPIFKWLFLLLAMTPMALFQAVSLSADCFTNAVSFLLISLFFRYSFDNNKLVKNIDICVLLTLTFLLSLSKSSYFPIILLYLMIPMKKIGSVKKYTVVLLLMLLLNALILTGWSFFAKQLYIPYSSYNAAHRVGQPLLEGVFPHEQFKFILSNFPQYTLTIIRSFRVFSGFVLTSFIGTLGWLDTPLSRSYIMSGFFVLFFFSLTETSTEKKISLKNKFVLSVSFLTAIFTFSTLMYISWTPVGDALISNLQGRYFIPLSPIFFSLFCNRKFYVKREYLGILGSCFLFFSLTYASLVLIRRYYLP